MPESYVFDAVIDQWPKIGGKVSVALLQEFNSAAQVLEICKDVRITNQDPHLLYAQLGERLGLLPEQTVVAAFCTFWAQNNPEEVQRILNKLDEYAPKPDKKAA
jgi:hypothetical protein